MLYSPLPFLLISLGLNILPSIFNLSSVPHVLISSAGINKYQAIYIFINLNSRFNTKTLVSNNSGSADIIIH